MPQEMIVTVIRDASAAPEAVSFTLSNITSRTNDIFTDLGGFSTSDSLRIKGRHKIDGAIRTLESLASDDDGETFADDVAYLRSVVQDIDADTIWLIRT